MAVAEPKKVSARDDALKLIIGTPVEIPAGEIRSSADASKAGQVAMVHEIELSGLQAYEIETMRDMAGKMAASTFAPERFPVGALPTFSPGVKMAVAVVIYSDGE